MNATNFYIHSVLGYFLTIDLIRMFRTTATAMLHYTALQFWLVVCCGSNQTSELASVSGTLESPPPSSSLDLSQA